MEPHDAPTPDPRSGEAVADFAGLSERHASRGEAREALLAMWASDLEVLQVLLWESGIGEAPDPVAQLAAVGDAVSRSVASVADDLAGRNVRQVAERCREALVAAFDESVHAVLTGRFWPLDHLDGLPAPSAAGAQQDAGALLEGRSPEQLLADLQVTAGDCMAVAEVMLGEGDSAGAAEQVRQADLAMFEAYLVAAALGAGDTGLASVRLRWTRAEAIGSELAQSGTELGGEPQADPVAALEPGLLARRERLAELVGWAESPVLRACFQPLGQR